MAQYNITLLIRNYYGEIHTPNVVIQYRTLLFGTQSVLKHNLSLRRHSIEELNLTLRRHTIEHNLPGFPATARLQPPTPYSVTRALSLPVSIRAFLFFKHIYCLFNTFVFFRSLCNLFYITFLEDARDFHDNLLKSKLSVLNLYSESKINNVENKRE